MKRSKRLRLVGPRAAVLSSLVRAALLVVVAVLLHRRMTDARVQGDAPITLAEVAAVLPGAATFDADSSARAGQFVVDELGQRIGYALHTLPAANAISGYAGPTDTLVVLDEDDRIAGIRIRSSADTPNHVDDVKNDREFMALLDGKTWVEAARFDWQTSEIDAVSGASLTARAMIDGVTVRLGSVRPAQPWRWDARDVVAIAVLMGALAMAFSRRPVRRPVRVAFSTAVVIALGFIGGDFVSQSLLVGWAAGGVPVRTSPGMVVLCAGAFLVPWVTGKGIYCQQICPHGLLQDFVAQLSRWRWSIRADIRRALRWLPACLLVVILAAALVGMPVDFSRFEPFDAFLLTTAAGLCVVWALLGLGAATVVPRAYCRFACPTGALLDALRAGRGTAVMLGRREWLLVALAACAAVSFL